MSDIFDSNTLPANWSTQDHEHFDFARNSLIEHGRDHETAERIAAAQVNRWRLPPPYSAGELF